MPSYLKLGDIKGESQDSFEFRPVSHKDDSPPHEEFQPTRDEGETGYVSLLLPAVQSFVFVAEKEPMALTEEFSMNYTEVEWTY